MKYICHCSVSTQVHAVAQIIFISLLITLQLGGCRVTTVSVILLLMALLI